MILGIAGVELEGNVFFEQTTNSFGASIIKVAFTEVHFSLFGGADSLVNITEASGFFVINDKGLAGKLSISIDFNLPNIIIDFDTVSVVFNTTNEDIYEEFNLPGGTEILDVAAGPYVMVKATGVSLGIEVSGTPYTIDADVLQIEQVTLPDSTKVVKVAAVGVSASAMGVELTDGWGGFIFYDDGMAGTAKTQLGFSSALEGEVTLAVNTTNRDVDDTITVDASNLRIKVSANTFALAASDTTLRFGDYFMLRGDYSLSIVDSGLPTERTLIAAANVRLFMGRGPPELEDGTINPDAIGVLVQASKVGVVKFADGTFAVYAVGSASIIGLGDGIYVEGTLEVKINNTGRVVSESIIMDPADPESETVDVVFATAQRTEVFEGSVTLGVGRVGSGYIFAINGTIKFTRDPIGQVQVDVPDASVSINIPDGSGGLQSAFSISGAAKFSFGGAEGFRLQDLRVNGFSVFGVSATIPQPAPTLRAPTANLSLPYHLGVFEVNEVNDRGYIEVVFNDVNDVGLNEGTITDDSHEFLLSVDGGTVTGVTINGRAEKVGESNVYRYTAAGRLPA